jgi:hypothetical protein
MLIPDSKENNQGISNQDIPRLKNTKIVNKFLPALLAVNFDHEHVAPKALLRKHTVRKQSLFEKLLRPLVLSQQGEAIR